MTRTVLHVVDTWAAGGAETVCADVASGLNREPWRACSVVIREGWVFTTLQARSLDPTIVRMTRRPFDFRFLFGLMRVARRQRADLIHSHLLTANLYSVVAGRLLGIPVVATFHGAVDADNRERGAALKLKIIGAGASRTVFVSESLRNRFVSQFRLPMKRTNVVHNGVDTERFRPIREGGLRSELAVAPDVVLVGLVGNLREAKGYDVMMRVARRVKETRLALQFVVAGLQVQPLYDRLLATRAELGLENVVHFLGYRNDPTVVFNGIDMYLSTSTSEGFSLTTVQAMASGLPVVATQSGGPEEIVSHGRDGLLVPVGDVDAIARALVDVAGDAVLRQRLGAEARRTAVERFSRDRMIAGYEAIYRSALGMVD